jgi:hypothetical protein
MRPRRHPARPGRAGTGLPGCRTSAAARTRAGSARASRRPAPARPFSKVQWSTSSSRSISTATFSRDPQLTIARGTDKKFRESPEAALCEPPHACCRRPLPAAPVQNPVSADCGCQNGTSPRGRPSPMPRRLLSRRVKTRRAGDPDIRCPTPNRRVSYPGWVAFGLARRWPGSALPADAANRDRRGRESMPVGRRPLARRGLR